LFVRQRNKDFAALFFELAGSTAACSILQDIAGLSQI
jgi:hypothetical protein